MSNLNIETIMPLPSPNDILLEIPISKNTSSFVQKTRQDILKILTGEDKRLIFIVGPCSIHDVDQALVYAKELKHISNMVKDRILVVMRTYFLKPRTTVGWKGLIHDPKLNETYDVIAGIKLARNLLNEINKLELPCGYEMLDTITPQYIADLMSWGAIGARTTESQIHRELVSGVSMPVGFKNGTGGTIKIAVDAMVSASYPHCFPGITMDGKPAICKTYGNSGTHLILRGGARGPNYFPSFIKTAELLIESANKKETKHRVNEAIMVDCSHGNSNKNHENQEIVLDSILSQKIAGNKSIKGVMIESNIREGNQPFKVTNNVAPTLKYGVSITDSCISLDKTRILLLYAYVKLKDLV